MPIDPIKYVTFFIVSSVNVMHDLKEFSQISGGERLLWPIHGILGLLGFLADRSGVHASGSSGDQGQVLCLHPSPAAP